MLKQTLLASAAAMVLAMPVVSIAQQNPPAKPPATAAAPAQNSPAHNAMKLDDLIGHDVVNKQNEDIGEINSIYVGKDGKIDSVIVGVGGFLGIGEREVALKWRDLTVTDNGDRIMVDTNKERLKAMPEYRYTNKDYRGKVFSDTGLVPRDSTRDNTDAGRYHTKPNGQIGMADRNNGTTMNDRNDNGTMKNGTTADNRNDRDRLDSAVIVHGNMSGNAIIGADVRNSANETIGTVQDIYVGKDGKVKGVVVGVGGFLGIGERNVMLSWDKVQMRPNKDNDELILTTTATKDSLKALPDYRETSL